MKQLLILFLQWEFLFPAVTAGAQDSLLFKGQLSAWGNYNHNNSLPLWIGIRYIPALEYSLRQPSGKLFDMEASANIYGSAGMHPFDTMQTEGNIKPYRVWMRYSTEQFEFRIGLQKINFGSASMLRPLMWFDQMDPRDPLQLTDGVWGALARYYFLNNANFWFWGLYGNTKPRGWELFKTARSWPELGGRLQLPIPRGEVAGSYHFRVADSREMADTTVRFAEVPENRVGLDVKWDLTVGLWFEGTWVNKTRDLGIFKNQAILNSGVDYTFGIGNGLSVFAEQLVLSYSKDPFGFKSATWFSALSVSYPVSLFDNINAIVFYDWNHRNSYNFIGWKRQFDSLTLHLMAYWNPSTYAMPQQAGTQNLFGGKGIQLMLVYNH